MRLMRRDLGMKILGISGKEVVGLSPSLGNRQEHFIPEGMDPWNEGRGDTGDRQEHPGGGSRSCSERVSGSSFPPHAPIPSVCCK